MKNIAALLVMLNICALCSCSASSTCNAGKLPDLSDPQIRQRIEAKKDKPDLELLSKITLPKDPTGQQARDYINAVLLASRNQQNYQASDPQVAQPGLIETVLPAGVFFGTDNAAGTRSWIRRSTYVLNCTKPLWQLPYRSR